MLPRLLAKRLLLLATLPRRLAMPLLVPLPLWAMPPRLLPMPLLLPLPLLPSKSHSPGVPGL